MAQSTDQQQVPGDLPSALVLSGDQQVPAYGDGSGERVLCSVEVFAEATGWVLKAQGACRGDVCVPRAMIADTLASGADDATLVDVAALCRTLAIPTAQHLLEDGLVIALGHSVQDRAAVTSSEFAPSFTLPDLDGVPFPVVGRDEDDLEATATRQRKRLLLAFASW